MSESEEIASEIRPLPDMNATERVDDDLYENRELSWLAFNARVLQEAADPRVPLFERVRFLAIYSSNLDEFFRVRVASLRSLLRLKSKHHRKLALEPEELLKRIHEIVHAGQEEFGRIYREELLPELAATGVHIVQPEELTNADRDFLSIWRREHLMPELNATIIRTDKGRPFLQNRTLYLVIRLVPRIERQPWSEESGESLVEPNDHLALVQIPTDRLPRFLELPAEEGVHRIIYLDDVIRDGRQDLFPGFDAEDAWSIKLTRDADLDIEDEFSGSLLKKIQKGLHKRETGAPSRFLYDGAMPEDIQKRLRKGLGLSREDMVAGGHYHNFHDFFTFPFPETEDLRLVNPSKPPHTHPRLPEGANIFEEISRGDIILHFPYQTYTHVIDLLESAAADSSVTDISISLYRVSSESRVAKALISAAEKGVAVTAFVELKARFDEESNIFWASEMEKAGVRVLYSFPGLKVHAKLCLIARNESSGSVCYAYLGTGNFNEKTSLIYADHALLTCDSRLTKDVAAIFSFLTGETRDPTFDHLLVAPFTLREQLNRKIDREIDHARNGRSGGITLKVNSLEDRQMIDRLYEAHEAGVTVRLIVRGIFCMRVGLPGKSESVEAISILDRWLEHARVYVFENDGEEEWYLGSADWMRRNLSKRIETAFPIYDEGVRDELRTIINLQLADNCHARYLDQNHLNDYRSTPGPSVRAQIDTYAFVEQLGR